MGISFWHIVIVVLVVVLPFGAGDGHAYRVWCDGTYGAWLWKTLVEIARELGGGPVGLDALR